MGASYKEVGWTSDVVLWLNAVACKHKQRTKTNHLEEPAVMQDGEPWLARVDTVSSPRNQTSGLVGGGFLRELCTLRKSRLSACKMMGLSCTSRKLTCCNLLGSGEAIPFLSVLGSRGDGLYGRRMILVPFLWKADMEGRSIWV